MGRYTGPAWRLSRREKVDLFPRSSLGKKSRFAERAEIPPGMHGQGRQKLSDYGVQLREKQKVKRIYGVLEKQFRNYYEKATKSKGVTGVVLLMLLERRLDNVVYRLNLAASRKQARQLVTHRHFRVNGKLVNIPSFIVKPGDVITIGERSKASDLFKQAIEFAANRRHPEWLEFSETDATSKVLALPGREQIDTPVDEQLIVEYYSR
jgi:small subunit ribosomal protein S4